MNVNSVDTRLSFDMVCLGGGCAWCDKPRAADVTLKQCGGCKVTRYCSKAANVKPNPGRPTSSCALRGPAPRSRRSTECSAQCATLAELIQAANDWTVIHKVGLFMLSTVLVELHGGVAVGLNDSHAVVFGLGPPKRYDGSPSTAFALTMGYCHRDDIREDVVKMQWSGEMVAHREAAAWACRDNQDAMVAGLVPVTF